MVKFILEPVNKSSKKYRISIQATIILLSTKITAIYCDKLAKLLFEANFQRETLTGLSLQNYSSVSFQASNVQVIS